MKLLVIFGHPSLDSYGGAVFERACRALRAAGHDLRIHDLYREGFDPVLSEEEWKQYLPETDKVAVKVSQHIEDLQWAEGLVVIYPTFFYGPPAMLKGWLERVWLPGVTFEVAEAKQQRPKPKLQNIRCFVGITTSGSPWWWIRMIRDPGRSLWTRGLRPMFHKRCKFRWRQLYDMNCSTQSDRETYLTKIETMLKGLPV